VGHAEIQEAEASSATGSALAATHHA